MSNHHIGPAPRAQTEREFAQRVRRIVEDMLGREVEPHTSFLELGLTSLSLVRIRLRLERELSRPLSDVDLFEHPTVAALAAYLASSGSRDSRDVPAVDSGAGLADPEQRIAVIGMAAYFPGARDVDQYWENLRSGVCSVSTFRSTRVPEDPDHRPVAGVLDDVDCFDAGFFGMTAREAEVTDPAHRLFLECCQHALEHGGYAGAGQRPRIGVYAGGGMNLYGPQPSFYERYGKATTDRETENVAQEMQGLIGGQYDFLASRVAYRLGLTGAAIGVQTACSTGLVAVHLAVQSLLAGENDLALAGAAAVHLPQDDGYRYEPDFIFSSTGHCRAFDAASDGTVGGNGVAAVLLKKLDRALSDGDTIHAVILGSAVNNDGDAKAAFVAPGVQGHAEVIRQALSRARIEPDSVSYVEAHGTGTELGDRVEFEALSRAYRSSQGRTGFAALGSVKPSVGHLDTCAGMAGLIKTVLMLRQKMIAPTVKVTRPNPRLSWDESPFRFATELQEWKAGDASPRRAGVSALGFGGTNAHVVLEEPPSLPVSPPATASLLVPLSAQNGDSLHELAVRLREYLIEHPDVSITDVQFSLSLGRPHLKYRQTVSGRSTTELVNGLEDLLRSSEREPVRNPGPLAFAFSGQGGSVSGIARGLYTEFSVIRDVLDECEDVYRQNARGSLLDVLLQEPDGPPPVAATQPALFAFQMALARLWSSFGIEPDLVVGHSLGEIAALCEAGALTLADALRFTTIRGRLMSAGTLPGRMLAVAADGDTVRRVCRATGADLAAVNGPRAHVLSGATSSIDEAEELLKAQGVTCVTLAVSRAFHSALIDPVLPQLRDAAAELRFMPLRIPCAGGAEGELLAAGTILDADFLVRQARRPVLFHQALTALDGIGCHDFLEVGPSDVLTGIGRSAFPRSRWTAGQGRDARGARGVWDALARLYRHGAPVTWARIAVQGRRIPMPGYPFRRDRFALPRTAESEVEAKRQTVDDAVPESLVAGLAGRQLALMGRLVDEVSDLMTAQLRALSEIEGAE
ncbi:acyltransferase domain-containing protein [Actinoallomurus purpureus]|uniref:type I polyketide synthase n=1 Tax=Actinoallomurus purpureus TaxID=478114 RepID=UPI002093F6C2|nr:type I polyketide synthase [Actinoallomurus purpureus]MCO6008065.1 acyltransferase domain-containing protein [Actinoallomurus purpureus]